MEATHTPGKYDVEASSNRIDDILSAAAGNFSDKENVPKRTELTYTNGFYVDVTSLFIDIVDSSELSEKHERPVLAKIYRSFLSECVAIMNGSNLSCEINIDGDCVWSIFDTKTKSDIDIIFNISAKLNSLIKILNYKFEKKGYETIKVGIGIDDGRALMIKAGYSGSGINDLVWMGDVVNQACHIANLAGRDYHSPVMLSECIYNNLNNENQGFCKKVWVQENYSYYYECNIIDTEMDNWYKGNCK
jgi:class 3 adenylate cyclase